MLLVKLKPFLLLLTLLLASHTSLEVATNVTPMIIEVYISLGGIVLPNNSYITVDMLGFRLDNNALICHTNNEECCHIRQTSENYPLGEWRYPNGSIVHFIDIRLTGEYPTFGRNRNRSIVRLWRVLEPKERGRFCCRIPDANFVNHTFCSHIVDTVPITIRVQPSSQYMVRGENAVFYIDVQGIAELSYQWYKDSEAIKDRLMKYEGANKAVLAVQNVSLQDVGVYTCAVSDHTGVVLSDQASLCLLPLNADTTNCLCFTGISKELCEVQKSAADNLEELLQAMTNITREKLQARDISYATDLLDRIVEVSSFHSVEIGEKYLTIMDNLIQSDGKELVESQIASNTSLRILACLNSFMDHVNISNYSSDSSMLTIFTRETFVLIIHNDSMSNISFNMEHSDKQIALEIGSHSQQNKTAVVTAVMRDSIFENLQNSSEGHRISFSVFLKGDLFQPVDSGRGLTLQSVVFGIRISGAQMVNLSSPIDVYFQADQFVGKDGEPLICGRWNTTHYGIWDTTACEASPLSANGSLLYRTRLRQFGHFSLLLDLTYKSNPLPENYSLALAVTSYLLLTVSTLCLVVFIVTYLISKQLRSNQHCQILINLSLSLLFLYFAFLVAAHASPVPILCVISAALLQSFFLVYFGWTSVESFFLYRNLVKVLLRKTPKFVLKAAMLVYSSAFLITALSAGPGYKSYPYHNIQTDAVFLCRPSDLPFWLGQILPFVAMNIFNWSLFTIIIVSVCKHRTSKDEEGEKVKELTKSNIIMTIGLANLCGLGWIFGLAASSLPVKELTFTFQLLFNIFVGSQGMILFFFHCIRNHQARQQWKVWFAYTSSVCSAGLPSTSVLKSDLSKTGSTKISGQVSSSSHTFSHAEENVHLKSCTSPR